MKKIKVQWSFPGCLFFENDTKENFKMNLILLVVFVLESKGLYYQTDISPKVLKSNVSSQLWKKLSG